MILSQKFFARFEALDKTCCLADRFGLRLKCKSCNAFSITANEYGRFVSGLTHMFAMMFATSLKDDSDCTCRSFSDTCKSPLSRIYQIFCSIKPYFPRNGWWSLMEVGLSQKSRMSDEMFLYILRCKNALNDSKEHLKCCKSDRSR